ncbi:transposase family protein [Streptomyces fuscichromogenes]|uniref:transposase family protein n=1 Tax=Streptomyces fuscichromogenes TaxID=1324013 RepID=UPI00382BC63B
MPAAVSSLISPVLVRLEPLDIGQVADLRPFLDLVPDPRARRGRWYSLTAILLVCACAAVSGARSIDEIAEWAARASDDVLTAVGVRRHPLRWRRSPSRTTIGRVLAAVDGDALDRAVGACLAGPNPARTAPEQRRVIAVDGRSLRGPARLSAGRRHLLSAVTHHRALTLAQAEVGAKTNETAHFRPLFEPWVLAVVASLPGSGAGVGPLNATETVASYREVGQLALLPPKLLPLTCNCAPPGRTQTLGTPHSCRA